MAIANLKLKVQLGKNFINEIKKTMEDELDEASIKWKIYPTNEEKKLILVNSFEQLKLRVQSVTREPWPLEDVINFSCVGPKESFEIPSKEADDCEMRIIRVRDGWIVDQERTEASILLKDLPDSFKNEILKWSRTAVFYGVGSLKR